jgi:hypothetical protein
LLPWFVEFGTAILAARDRHVTDKPTPQRQSSERVRHGNAGRRREFPVAAGVDYNILKAGL